ncbi:MAG: hypothetical protein KDA65_18180, partial [Planctomycetaceae bacterium]|nr:hypothetical protein [Planctomycetaceae bacterium]
MRRIFLPFECKPVDDLAPIQPKLPEDDPTDDDLVTSYEKQVVATDWSISLNESITFDPFSEVFYSRGDKFAVGVSTIYLPDQTVTANGTKMYNELLPPDQQDRLDLAHGFVIVNADNTITYTPHENLQYSWRPDHYTTLKPEYDRDENIVRFSGIDTFQAHLFPIVDRYGTAVAADKRDSIVATQSTSMQLAVSNNLPVMMGDFMHLPDGRTHYQIPGSDPQKVLPVNYMLLDGPISLPKQTRAEFSLNDLIYDADKNQSYKVLGAHVVGNWKGLDGDALDYQFTGTEFVSLGVRPSFSAVGQRVPLVVTAEPDGTIALTNMVAPTDISASWNTEGQSGKIEIDIFFTDGQKYNFRNWPTGSPAGYNGDEVVYSARITVIPDVYETHQQWRTAGGITTPDPREWLTYASTLDNSFTPAVAMGALVPPNPGSTPVWRIHSEEVTGTLNQRVFEDVGGTYVDVINGTYTVPHSLILDGSGGNSKIPLGGLLYDSGTVYVDTTEVTVPPVGQLTPELLQEHLRKYTTLPAIHFLLDGLANEKAAMPNGCYQLTDDSRPEELVARLQWDPEGTASPATAIIIDLPADFCWKEKDNFFTVRPDIIADRSGVHFWNLEVDILFPEVKNIDPVTVRKSGEASIIRGDIDGMFGQGWWLQGFPSLFLDNRRSMETNDDRFMLFFPGSEPYLFDATRHSKSIDSWEGELPNISLGSVPHQSPLAGSYAAELPGGVPDFQQTGTLVVDQVPDGDSIVTEVTYRTGNGDDYVFRRTEMKDADANPYYVYLLNRIRPSAVPFDPAEWTNQDRGATVTWREDLPDGTPPRIHEISLPDGSTTRFDLNGNHFVHEIITTIPDADPRKVRLEIVAEDTTTPPILKSITNIDQFLSPINVAGTAPNPDAVHKFEYSNPSYPNFANKHGLLINEKWIEEDGDTQWIR